jgi:hypothetical protein
MSIGISGARLPSECDVHSSIFAPRRFVISRCIQRAAGGLAHPSAVHAEESRKR